VQPLPISYISRPDPVPILREKMLPSQALPDFQQYRRPGGQVKRALLAGLFTWLDFSSLHKP